MSERLVYLARFRANPRKIRITVRRFDNEHGVYWRAGITELATEKWVSAAGSTAARAVVKTWRLAEEEEGMDGIDRHMEWTYDHPQRELAPPDRVSVFRESEMRRPA